jgi:hypothetical protein
MFEENAVPDLRRKVRADRLLCPFSGGHFRVARFDQFRRTIQAVVRYSFHLVAMDLIVCSCVQGL